MAKTGLELTLWATLSYGSLIKPGSWHFDSTVSALSTGLGDIGAQYLDQT